MFFIGSFHLSFFASSSGPAPPPAENLFAAIAIRSKDGSRGRLHSDPTDGSRGRRRIHAAPATGPSPNGCGGRGHPLASLQLARATGTGRVVVRVGGCTPCGARPARTRRRASSCSIWHMQQQQRTTLSRRWRQPKRLQLQGLAPRLSRNKTPNIRQATQNQRTENLSFVIIESAPNCISLQERTPPNK